MEWLEKVYRVLIIYSNWTVILNRDCICNSCLERKILSCVDYSFSTGIIPKNFHQTFLDGGGGESQLHVHQ